MADYPTLADILIKLEARFDGDYKAIHAWLYTALIPGPLGGWTPIRLCETDDGRELVMRHLIGD